MLTREQFQEAKIPYYFLRIRDNKWSDVQKTMIKHWLEANCGGWFYWADEFFVFEHEGDQVMFKIFISGNALEDEIGEISTIKRY